MLTNPARMREHHIARPLYPSDQVAIRVPDIGDARRSVGLAQFDPESPSDIEEQRL